MSVESCAWNWTQAREKAALAVAEDALPDRQIAADAGVSERTLERWKQRPEFAARVAAHVEAFRQAVLTQGIADKVNRMQRLDTDWKRLQEVIAARAADPTMQTVPGGKTGLLARQVKFAKLYEAREDEGEGDGLFPLKRVILVEEFAVDTGLLSELRAVEVQAAKEMGQWIDRSESTVNDRSAAETLERKLDSLAARIGASPVPEPTDGSGSG